MLRIRYIAEVCDDERGNGMLLAVLGDCNGHAAALGAALNHIAEEGILTIFQTGNLAGPEGSDSVIQLLREHGVRVCQGEMDRMLVRFEQKSDTFRRKLEQEEFDWIAAAHARLSSEGLEYLRGLSKRIDREVDGIKMHCCHGSPASQSEIIDAETPHTRLQRHRESSGAALLMCGGAKEPFHRWVDGALFVGPGHLVAAPGEAQFTLIDTDAAPWQVTVVRLAY